MANIGVRSPYFIYETETGTVGGLPASYATMTLDIGVAEQYVITKQTGQEFLLDIAELVRDFVTPYYQGSIGPGTAGAVALSYTLNFYNSAGDLINVSPYTGSHTAFDAYSYFSEGNNFEMSSNSVMLSHGTIWYPEDESGFIFVLDASGNLQVETFPSDATQVSGITIRRLPCSKYNTKKLVFVNKFGVLQELYFTAKSSEAIATKGDNYKSGYITANGAVDTYRHQIVDFNKNAKTSYTLNTTFICQGINIYIQELLLSEQVWLQDSSGVFPVRVTSSSVQYKTSVNDKLINYTIEVEEANDLISTVR